MTELEKIKKSVEAATRRYVDTIYKTCYFDPKRLPTKGLRRLDDFFWAAFKDGSVIKKDPFKARIMAAAESGDVEFFIRLGQDLKRSKGSPSRAVFLLIANWTEPMPLYACSDKVITEFLNYALKASYTEGSVRKLRQRLRLTKASKIRFRRFIAFSDHFVLE